MSGAVAAPTRARIEVSIEAAAEPEARDEITFLGRGLAIRSGARLRLLVCPLCSQRNGRRGAERGVCEWCAYEPSLRDAEPLRSSR